MSRILAFLPYHGSDPLELEFATTHIHLSIHLSITLRVPSAEDTVICARLSVLNRGDHDFTKSARYFNYYDVPAATDKTRAVANGANKLPMWKPCFPFYA
ncbi:hypothetical protein GALMADRAFT_242804 [Galerina marginata CBS 339.88]|uniref:Uncharacterized protein n=1 Tax=Galerina marginata (strain CBS 339.88) TaxID=685588 RepID=A0A067TDH2_GALM3|nr:hypothetical protein GALMADRAFT_242804 [Galerina marginata CBS 339.88]